MTEAVDQKTEKSRAVSMESPATRRQIESRP